MIAFTSAILKMYKHLVFASPINSALLYFKFNSLFLHMSSILVPAFSDLRSQAFLVDSYRIDDLKIAF